MQHKKKLPPETIALRQMIATGLVSFVVGFFGVFGGLLWMQYTFAPDQFASWEWIMRVLQAIHLAIFGGLCLCAASTWLLSRVHHRKGYHRCPSKNRVLL